MLYGTLQELEKQFSHYSPNFKKAFEALASLDLTQPQDFDTLDVAGDACFIVNNKYETKPHTEVVFESHEQYADIQLMLTGEEVLAFVPSEKGLSLAQAYDAENDFKLFRDVPNPLWLPLKPGLATILLPGEPHAPGFMDGHMVSIHKLVVKVKI